MAPARKGQTQTKRAAPAVEEPPHKKAATVLKKYGVTQASFKQMADVLEHPLTSHLPEDCKKMLLAMLPQSLCVPDDHREDVQRLAVTMFGEVVATVEAKLQEALEAEKLKVQTITNSKEQLVEEVTKAQAKLKEAQDHSEEKDAALKSSSQAVVAAKGVLVKKEEEALGVETKMGGHETLKAELEAVFKGDFQNLKAGDWTESPDSHLKALEPCSAKLDLEESLKTAMIPVLRKKPSERAGFDTMVLEQLEKGFQEKLQSLDGILQQGAPERQARKLAVDEANAKLGEAEEKQKECSSELLAAKQTVKEAAAALKEAEGAVANFEVNVQAAKEIQEEKHQELSDWSPWSKSRSRQELIFFVDNTVKGFNDLKDGFPGGANKMQELELELQAVIGFKGTVQSSLILHPDQEHLIFPLGCTVVLRNLIKRTQAFLQGHDNQVNCITVSKSGKLLASGQKTFMGFPADVIIWDFEQRKEIHRLSLHKVAVTSLSFSCDETYLATLGGQDDNSLVIWEVERGLAVCGTPAATDTAHCVRFFNNTEFSLVTGGNYHVVIWQFDLANKKLRPTQANLGQMKRITTNVLIDHEDKFVYCGTTTGDLLQVELGHALFKQYTPKGGPSKTFALGITTSALLPDGDVVLGTGNGVLARISGDTLRVKQQCQVLGGVTSVALTEDGTHFFCGTTLSNIYWVDTDTLTAELRNTCHHERINQVAFPADYSEVFATCSVTDIRVWNAVTRQELLRIQVPNMECFCLDFMRDGKSIISGWSDGKVRAFLPQSGKLLYAINDAHQNGVTALALSSDCGRIVTGGMEGEVRVWNIGFQTQTMDASLKEHRGRVWCIKIAKDDTQAVSASADGSCIIWDLHTKTRKLCLFESTMFKSLVYHPDESQLLTTGSDRKVAYWDTFDGQAIRVLEGSEEGEITTLSVSKSGSHYVSGGEERLVKLWDYDKGVSEYIGVGHSGTITCAAISPDASFVVSTGSEGAILIWTVPSEVSAKCNEPVE
ncbi:Cilia- and flagella-associated protein 52 [Durusdinium trenchii]|uniref:Cilia- and flagella-associated protein 52 n=1 Tax=Durusdinium trenchii TaxID=1381693 RepID=A0ABP0JBK2_9DINO